MMKQINYLDYAEYNEIICRLIYEFNISSQIKVIFIAFSIKNNSDNIKSTKQIYGTLDIILDGIKLGLRKGVSDFEIIFDCLDLLKNNGFIEVRNGVIDQLKSAPSYSKENHCLNTPVIHRAISEAEKLSDDSIIRGVIEYV